MSIFEFLFGLRGRINRIQWWTGALSVLVIAGAFLLLWNTWVTDFGLPADAAKDTQLRIISLILIAATLIASALIWMFFALTIKRIHDHGRSDLWAFAYAFPLLLTIVLPNLATKSLAAITLAWALIDLGLLPGHSQRAVPSDDQMDDVHIDGDLDVITVGPKQTTTAATTTAANFEVGEWPEVERAATFGRRG